MSPGLLASAHALSAATAADPSIGASLLKMVLGLGAVIGSILVVSKVLQYTRGTPRQKNTSSLEVLSRQSLGKGLQLAIVRFSGREVLVGIAGQHISFYDEPGLARSPLVEPDDATMEEEARAFASDDALAALFSEQSPSRSVDALAFSEMMRRGGSSSALFGRRYGAASGRSMIERLRDATARS